MENSVQYSKSILIWDKSELSPDSNEFKVLWQSYTVVNSDKEISIPQLVEDNANELRSKYLAFIYDLGETKIGKKQIIDYLEVRLGFSYWWMTLLTEKCNFAKSPQVNNIIKLLAFSKWFEGCCENKITRIKIVTENAELSEAIKLFAINRVIKYECIRTSPAIKINLIRKCYNNLPYEFQALLFLIRYIFFKWRCIGVGKNKWNESTAKTTFVSYLFNYGQNKADIGIYSSHYWADLPELLTANRRQSNWIHIYIKSAATPNAKVASDVIKKFNKINDDYQTHIMLDSFVSAKSIINVLKDWQKLYVIKQNIQKFVEYRCGLLWPLLKHDFYDSLIGKTAINNLLSFNLFEQAMMLLPIQEKGVYLQENQGWEYGFINAWNANGHKGLIGCPHSTVRYWDLRYFHDARLYAKTSNCAIPLPDYVGVNGQSAKNMYLGGGYPKKMLVDVDALRYKYLSGLSIKKTTKKSNVNNDELTVLVLGDYLKKNTLRQMCELHLSSKNINRKVCYLVKPHPNCFISPENYPELNITITNNKISSIIEECDLAYTSPITSAALDAYYSGLPVITLLDPTELNMSPLRGNPNVTFVSSQEELSGAINEFRFDNEIKSRQMNYFFFDFHLNRWRTVLGIAKDN